MHDFAMFMSVSSFLAYPTGPWYDTQQLGRGGLVVNMMHWPASDMTSVWNQPFENQKLQENIIVNN